MNRIQLGNAVFEGLNDVYVFGADADTTTLVDTGIATPETREELTTGLADLGIGLADVDQILLTHWHEDHAGLASAVQDESGATVRVHAADAPLVSGDADAREAMENRQRALLDEWGVPEGPREELLAFLDAHDGLSGTAGVEPFENGALALPSFHVIGRKDSCKPMSLALAQCFRHPSIVYHDGLTFGGERERDPGFSRISRGFDTRDVNSRNGKTGGFFLRKYILQMLRGVQLIPPYRARIRDAFAEFAALQRCEPFGDAR